MILTSKKQSIFPFLVTDFKNYFPENGDAFEKTKRGYCQAWSK